MAGSEACVVDDPRGHSPAGRPLRKGMCERHYARVKRHGSTDYRGRVPYRWCLIPKCRGKAEPDICTYHRYRADSGEVLIGPPIDGEPNTCIWGDCTGKPRAYRLCKAHYMQWQRGTLGRPELPPRAKSCRLCERKHYAKGLCHTHWSATRRRAQGVAERPLPGVCHCGLKTHAKGLCMRHYGQANRARKIAGRPKLMCSVCGVAEARGRKSGKCKPCYDKTYNARYNAEKRDRTPRPAPAPEKVLIGEWIKQGPITVVHWPKGVACPVCAAASAAAA